MFSRFKDKILGHARFIQVRAMMENWAVRHALRATRVGVLTFGVYNAGYSNGIMDYAKDREAMELTLLKSVLAGCGAKDVLSKNSHSEYAQLDRVGTAIVNAAIHHCEEELRCAEKNIQIAKHLPSTNPGKAQFLAESQESIEKHQGALNKLRGSWSFYITDADVPNAFVTDLLPRRIFVNIGLLGHFHPSDDELGFVLGHEISHLLCDHSSSRNQMEFSLAGIQLVLLSFVDPTGMFSFAFDYMVGKVATYVLAARSRECELEADFLGVQITARACYDTTKGMTIIHKLASVLEGVKVQSSSSSQSAISAAPTTVLKTTVAGADVSTTGQVGVESDGTGRGSGSLPGTATAPVVTASALEATTTASVVVPQSSVSRHASWAATHPSFNDRIPLLEQAVRRYPPQAYGCAAYVIEELISSGAGTSTMWTHWLGFTKPSIPASAGVIEEAKTSNSQPDWII